MSYVEAHFNHADEARMCEIKLQSLRLPSVRMTEEVQASPEVGAYLLQAEVPQQMWERVQVIIQDHSGFPS
ncbi:hypothetical protein MH117_10590 [Paenibacillus sp. ACRRX]|uniref:hypothetical protein n=1 Tax=Paenibacillus sp. ACRRX TaxID=2918206 RepID=UPI001EF569DC|nr:hypothetical protein [Paenibacillus sp. ACRRX]MCG7407868.1 hypothetical protein [Paenibacillus sp. ACRRX]